jgi:hypothetical protein
MFVATNGSVANSTNGESWTWTNRGRSDSVTWTGSQFVTVGGYGCVGYSANGTDWTFGIADVPGATFRAVAWSGSQYAVVGNGGGSGYSPQIYTSGDGSAWIARSVGIGMSEQPGHVAWCGTQFIAVGYGGLILTFPEVPSDAPSKALPMKAPRTRRDLIVGGILK